MSLPMGIDMYLSPVFYQTSAKLIYRSGESGFEKRKPIRLQPKLQEEGPAYRVSVSPISETKTDS